MTTDRPAEIWRTVADFPDYQVSDQGRVRSMKRNPPTILKANIEPSGHLRLSLRMGGR